MGSKNNPKNRGFVEKKKFYQGKEIEPVVFYDKENSKKYLSAKFCKTTDIICGNNGEPIKWEDVISE